MAISAGPVSRGVITRVRWNDRTVLTVRSIIASVASPSKFKSGLSFKIDAFLDLVRPGLESGSGAALALKTAGKGPRLRRS